MWATGWRAPLDPVPGMLDTARAFGRRPPQPLIHVEK